MDTVLSLDTLLYLSTTATRVRIFAHRYVVFAHVVKTSNLKSVYSLCNLHSLQLDSLLTKNLAHFSLQHPLTFPCNLHFIALHYINLTNPSTSPLYIPLVHFISYIYHSTTSYLLSLSHIDHTSTSHLLLPSFTDTTRQSSSTSLVSFASFVSKRSRNSCSSWHGLTISG